MPFRLSVLGLGLSALCALVTCAPESPPGSEMGERPAGEDGGPPSASVPRSGTRLRQRYVQGTDGSRIYLDMPVRDSVWSTKLGRPVFCSYQKRYEVNGHLYCLPIDLQEKPDLWTDMFADNACRQFLFVKTEAAACDPAPLFGVYFLPVAGEECRPVIKLARLKEIPKSMTIYKKSGAACSAEDIGIRSWRFFVPDQELSLADFQEGTEVLE